MQCMYAMCMHVPKMLELVINCNHTNIMDPRTYIRVLCGNYVQRVRLPYCTHIAHACRLVCCCAIVLDHEVRCGSPHINDNAGDL